MRIRINKTYWNFVREECSECIQGYCDDPRKKNKKIIVDPELYGLEELDTIIHELLHAADYTKTEAWVNESATDIAAVLWKLGYRISK